MKTTILFLSTLVLYTFIGCKSSIGQGDSKENNNMMIRTSEDNLTGIPAKPTKADFLEKIMDYETNPEVWKYKGELPAIIDFYADWCGPCKTTSPILEEIAKEYSGKILVYKIDTDKEKELASVFGIRSIPSFLYIPKEGKPTMTSGIARTKEETKQMFIDMIKDILL